MHASSAPLSQAYENQIVMRSRNESSHFGEIEVLRHEHTPGLLRRRPHARVVATTKALIDGGVDVVPERNLMRLRTRQRLGGSPA